MKNTKTLLGNDFFDRRSWDKEASCYDVMNSMEIDGTEKELNALPLLPSDTVLDIGCGPGRMMIPVSKRVREVIGIDSSPAMVEICKNNIKHSGVTNATCFEADWEADVDYKKLPAVDIIIQARWSGGASSLKKYREICRKFVVFIEWEKNPPRIARNLIFNECYSDSDMQKYEELQPFDLSAYTARNSEKQIKERKDDALRAELISEGIEMHSMIIEGGWTYRSEHREDILRKVVKLSPHPELVNITQMEKNIKSYINKDEKQWRFYFPTWSKVEWFSVVDGQTGGHKNEDGQSNQSL